jgi:hypothetical protein
MLEALLEMHLDPQGKEALMALNIDRFVVVDVSTYENIFTMASTLRGWDVIP